MEMIALVLLLTLLKLVQSGGLKSFTETRMGCYSALALAKASQCPDMFYYKEETVHRVAHALRSRGKTHLGMGFQNLLVIGENLYIKYLKRMRVEVLSRKILGEMVENAMEMSVREYIPTVTEVNVLQYKPVPL